MVRPALKSSSKPISEINLTPLMDLTFILLITFIITFPLVETGITVNLPSAQADPLPDQTKLTLSIDAAGQLYLDDLPLTSEQVEARIMGAVGTDPDVVVLVRADEVLPYGRVAAVLKMLHGASVRKLALVTRESGGG